MSYLTTALLFLAAAVLLVPLCRKLNLGAVLGYLLAGILIGPSGLQLVGHVDEVMHISELGVILLLFIIGLELQPSRLWVLRRSVFGLGSAQVLFSALVIGLCAYAFGIGWKASLVAGVGLAMSSTAFALQTLAERQELTARHGRDAFSILLFQDISVIPLLALLPLLTPMRVSDNGNELLDAVRAIGTIAAVIVGGRLLLRPAFRIVARAGSRELFTAAALLTVLGTALALQWAGLSMSLGAFLAGVLLADSECRHELEANIEPFKGLLLGLFFMAVGMSANLSLMVSQPWVLLGMTLGLMAIKAAVLFVIARIAGARHASAIKLGVALAQGGEFTFVLFGVAAPFQIIPALVNDTLVMAVTLSMMLAPFFFIAYDKLLAARLEKAPQREYDSIEDQGRPVIIAGFGRFGQVVARVLGTQGIPFTALDKSTQQVDFVRRFGNAIYYGDVARLDLLEAAGVGRARLFVLAIDDVEASIMTAELLRRHYPQLPVLARARNRFHAYKLMDLGVKLLFRETLGSSLEMAGQVLIKLGKNEADADKIVQAFRQADASLLQRQHAVYQDESLLIQTSQQAAEELKHLFESDTFKLDNNNTHQETK